MGSSLSRSACRSTTSTPTRGDRSSFAIRNKPRNASRKWPAIVTPIGSLDDFTDLIQRTLQRVPEVSKVQRAGVLGEEIYLEYSDDRLAAFKMQPGKLKDILAARNITAPGGQVQTQSRNVLIDPTGEFKSTKEIGNVLVGASTTGVPVYSARPRRRVAWVPDSDTLLELHDLSRCER